MLKKIVTAELKPSNLVSEPEIKKEEDSKKEKKAEDKKEVKKPKEEKEVEEAKDGNKE